MILRVPHNDMGGGQVLHPQKGENVSFRGLCTFEGAADGDA